MALHTLGTNSNTSLSAFIVGPNDVIAADVATLLVQLKTDPIEWNAANQGTVQSQINQAYVRKGTLFLPNGRGKVLLKTNDVIAWDVATGWPIVVSGYSANGNGGAPWHLV
jgi:hypothetical protein